jgi:tetratricopeptide (TPR) repeat protein
LVSSGNPVEVAKQLFHKGEFDAAYEAFVRASFTHPNDSEIVIGLGLTLKKIGRFDDAIRQWQNLRRSHSGSYQGIYQLHHAAALIEIGALDEAKALVKAVDKKVIDNGFKLHLVNRLMELAANDKGHNRSISSMRGAGSLVAENDSMRLLYQELTCNSGVPDPGLRFESVILVTYGRTGSTLLQGILNTIDGVQLLGENDGAFMNLFEYTRTIEKLSLRPNTSLPSSPFYGAGALQTGSAFASARNAVETYFAPFVEAGGVSCFGFKDVCLKDHPGLVEEYLSFLEQAFPNPAFVFLWRSHDAVLNSGFWKQEDKVRAEAVLTEVEDRASEFAVGRNNCFALDYTDLAVDAPRLSELFAFIGAHYDAEKISKIIEIPHSYNPERPEIQDLFHKTAQAKEEQ